MSTIHYPSFYKVSQVGTVYRPNVFGVVAEGRQVGWKPAARDGRKVALFLVDMQIDFCHGDGALPVPGALDDVRRVLDLIYGTGDKISTIAATMDTHYPFMIFFSPWWIGANGQHPEPFTIITEEDIKRGVWQAIIEPAWSHSYVAKLAEQGKYQLMIWPFHCMDGSEGFNLLPPLYEAIMFHAAARFTQPVIMHKGHIPQTEFYSPLRPEVDVPGVPGGSINTPFLNLLANHEVILVAGEAKSHCVLSAMETLVAYFGVHQPDVLKRIFFLEDCTSSVQHPQVDFEAIASARLRQMASDHGIQLLRSSEVSL